MNSMSYVMLFLCVNIISVLSVSKIFNTPLYVDPEFEIIFNQFKKDAKKYNADVDLYKLTTIFNEQLPSGIAAYCLPATNTVVVSREVWQDLNDNGKEALLYHEWGHCTLKREHAEDMQIPYSYCPISIMHPYIHPVESCYSDLRDFYVEELFTNPYNYEKIPRRD